MALGVRMVCGWPLQSVTRFHLQGGIAAERMDARATHAAAESPESPRFEVKGVLTPRGVSSAQAVKMELDWICENCHR